MTTVTIVSDETTEVAADLLDGRVLVDADMLPHALGWTLKPEGLCRADTCVPVRDRDALFVGEQLDLVKVADALGRLSVVDADAAILAVAIDQEQRRAALDGLTAPDITLRDLDGDEHSLS